MSTLPQFFFLRQNSNSVSVFLKTEAEWKNINKNSYSASVFQKSEAELTKNSKKSYSASVFQKSEAEYEFCFRFLEN